MTTYIDTNKIYTLTNDYLFKKIFREEKYLKKLLYVFFRIKAKKIKYLNPELIKDTKETKVGIVDLLIEIDEAIVILELQNLNRYNLKERMLFYLSSVLVHECLQNNEDYTKLKKCKMLVIVNYNFLNSNILNEIKLKYNETIFSDLIEYNVLELKKLKTNKNNKTYNLGYLFTGNLNNKIIFKDQTLNEIYQKILFFNKVEEERLEMGRFDYLNAFNDDYWTYNAGKIDGKKEGKKEGRIDGLTTTATNMLKNNLSIDLVKKCTGLNIKQILKIQEKLKG